MTPEQMAAFLLFAVAAAGTPGPSNLLLTATGARRQTVVLSGVDALTPSERRVARMAADGLSNPQIAQALYLTRRTVETHLTHAYEKLRISGRDQLHTVLANHETS